MITNKQCKAARALLGWHISHLANHSGISQVAISGFESENTKPHSKTIESLKQTFVKYGVEFGPNDRVERRDDRIQTVEGEDYALKMLDDVYYTLKDWPDPDTKELLLLYIDENINTPEIDQAFQRIKNAGIRIRSIISDKNFWIKGLLEDYRQIPDRFFLTNPILIYARKCGFFTSEPPRCQIIIDPVLSQSERAAFEFFWHNGVKPNKTKVPEDKRYV